MALTQIGFAINKPVFIRIKHMVHFKANIAINLEK